MYQRTSKMIKYLFFLILLFFMSCGERISGVFVIKTGVGIISTPNSNRNIEELNAMKKKYLDLYYKKINQWLNEQGFSSKTYAKSSYLYWDVYGDTLVVNSYDFYCVNKNYWIILLKNLNESKREYESFCNENYIRPGIELELYFENKNSEKLKIAVDNSFQYFLKKMEQYPRELFE